MLCLCRRNNGASGKRLSLTVSYSCWVGKDAGQWPFSLRMPVFCYRSTFQDARFSLSAIDRYVRAVATEACCSCIQRCDAAGTSPTDYCCCQTGHHSAFLQGVCYTCAPAADAGVLRHRTLVDPEARNEIGSQAGRGAYLTKTHLSWAITPPADHQPPTTNHQPPTTNHQPPTTNHQPPTTNHQPPTTNHQPPTTNHQPPTTNHHHNHQPPTTNHQPPTTNHQPPTTNHQPRTANGERRTANRPPPSTQNTQHHPSPPSSLDVTLRALTRRRISESRISLPRSFPFIRLT
nr:hypothetical protein HUO10_004685 [Paraburkholderia busanensis]